MEDIQSLTDGRNVPLERVGISDLKLPVRILEQSGGHQSVVAELSLFVEVAATARGTHMSRFVEVLHEWVDRPVSSVDVGSLLEETRQRAHSVSAEVGIDFLYFLPKNAPVSQKLGFIDYRCGFRGRLDSSGQRFELVVGVPVTTLCPCSKAISEYGAHNQRTVVTVRCEAWPGSFVWLEDLIRSVEDQASCQLYSVLKREDEKWVTEHAYENPKFVEDVARDVALLLESWEVISGYAISCESLESIHNHTAVASIPWVAKAKLVSGGDELAMRESASRPA